MNLPLMNRLCVTYPALRGVSRDLWQHTVGSARQIAGDAGQCVFHAGQPCQSFLLLLAGTVRVQRLSADGREITLYRVQPGQTCELATVCLLASKRYPVEAVAETRYEGLLMDRTLFQHMLSTVDAFRDYVFASIDQGMGALLTLLEDVAFTPLDRRIAQALLRNAANGDTVRATHLALASELGTAREVVSRHLKDFERHGWVELRRGNIRLCDRIQLQALAATSHAL
jgi:CRP/FNR family transcriptional regulator